MQLSLATTLEVTSGTAAWQLAFTTADFEAGQNTTGAVLSTTVTVVEAWELKLPVSMTVSEMTCEPRGKRTARVTPLPSTVPPSRHSNVSGSWSGSLDLLPSSTTWVGHSTVWLGPASATGGWLAALILSRYQAKLPL